MRALWSDRPNCSHNVSQKFKPPIFSPILAKFSRFWPILVKETPEPFHKVKAGEFTLKIALWDLHFGFCEKSV